MPQKPADESGSRGGRRPARPSGPRPARRPPAPKAGPDDDETAEDARDSRKGGPRGSGGNRSTGGRPSAGSARSGGPRSGDRAKPGNAARGGRRDDAGRQGREDRPSRGASSRGAGSPRSSDSRGGRPGREERPSDRGRTPRSSDSRGDRAGRGESASNRALARERAESARQPYRPPRKAGPRRPSLPEERPIIPRDAWRDLRATVPANVLDEVVKAVGSATDALEAGDTKRATELLTWAKSVATRSGTIREALGVTYYAAGKYAEAHSELLAYRRLSAAHDQNHLLADCARAAGRHDKVHEYVEQMIAAGVEPARVAEGLIVLAGDRADAGDLEGALDTLRRADLDPVKVEPWHPRVWYVAGDLSERLGLLEQAREYFGAILAVDDEFGDVEDRLAALDVGD